MKVIASLMMIISAHAWADIVLTPGQVATVGGERIACVGESKPDTSTYLCYCLTYGGWKGPHELKFSTYTINLPAAKDECKKAYGNDYNNDAFCNPK